MQPEKKIDRGFRLYIYIFNYFSKHLKRNSGYLTPLSNLVVNIWRLEI